MCFLFDSTVVLASNTTTVQLYIVSKVIHALIVSGCVLQDDKLNALIKAAGVSIEPFWPGLFAKVRLFPPDVSMHALFPPDTSIRAMETSACHLSS